MLWVQSQNRRLGYLMDSDSYVTPYFIDEIQRELPKITLKDVNEALRRHLNFESLQIAAVTTGAEEFKKDLVENKASPITYATKVPESILAEDREIQAYPLKIEEENMKVIIPEDLFEK